MTWKLTGPGACALAFALAAGTCMAQDAPPKRSVGERFDNAVQDLKKGTREAGQSIQQEFSRAKTSVHNMGVASRIYGRLHWDKDLQGSKIDIDVKQDGAAILTGTVLDAKAKAKAVALTRDTVGVSRVTDQTTIGPITETTTTTTRETKVETTTKP